MGSVVEKKPFPLSKNYLDFATKLAIEIDIKAEVENFASEKDYIYEKTSNMLAFGIPKVICITTRAVN